MMYTRDEVRSATLAFFKNDALATDVFVDKYALRDQNENFYELTPVDSFVRLAKEFARIESKYPNPLSVEQIYQYLAKVEQEILPGGHRPTLEELMNATVDYGEIVPQGSPQAGIGNPYQLQSLSNCFVIEPPQDSYGGILYTDQQQTQIMKRRGGVGFDISTIRPKGMPTTNAAKTTDGIGVFMERFSNSCREVAQGGRRGALLLSISCFEGNTQILTDIGWQSIQDVVENKYDGKVWTHEGFKEIEDYQKIDNKELYEVETLEGKKITVTSDHEFMVHNVKNDTEYLKQIKDIDFNDEELVMYDVTF